jgi:hypothetical protein
VVWAYVFRPRQQHPAKPPTAGMLVLPLLNPKANLSSWMGRRRDIAIDIALSYSPRL